MNIVVVVALIYRLRNSDITGRSAVLACAPVDARARTPVSLSLQSRSRHRIPLRISEQFLAFGEFARGVGASARSRNKIGRALISGHGRVDASLVAFVRAVETMFVACGSVSELVADVVCSGFAAHEDPPSRPPDRFDQIPWVESFHDRFDAQEAAFVVCAGQIMAGNGFGEILLGA